MGFDVPHKEKIKLSDGTKGTVEWYTPNYLETHKQPWAFVRDEDGYIIGTGKTVGEAISNAEDKHS